ncbi:MAG: hypothetical protein ACTSUE_26085 [Promethearchaeota archaeon]
MPFFPPLPVLPSHRARPLLAPRPPSPRTVKKRLIFKGRKMNRMNETSLPVQENDTRPASNQWECKND